MKVHELKKKMPPSYMLLTQQRSVVQFKIRCVGTLAPKSEQLLSAVRWLPHSATSHHQLGGHAHSATVSAPASRNGSRQHPLLRDLAQEEEHISAVSRGNECINSSLSQRSDSSKVAKKKKELSQRDSQQWS